MGRRVHLPVDTHTLVGRKVSAVDVQLEGQALVLVAEFVDRVGSSNNRRLGRRALRRPRRIARRPKRRQPMWRHVSVRFRRAATQSWGRVFQ